MEEGPHIKLSWALGRSQIHTYLCTHTHMHNGQLTPYLDERAHYASPTPLNIKLSAEDPVWIRILMLEFTPLSSSLPNHPSRFIYFLTIYIAGMSASSLDWDYIFLKNELKNPL